MNSVDASGRFNRNEYIVRISASSVTHINPWTRKIFGEKCKSIIRISILRLIWPKFPMNGKVRVIWWVSGSVKWPFMWKSWMISKIEKKLSSAAYNLITYDNGYMFYLLYDTIPAKKWFCLFVQCWMFAKLLSRFYELSLSLSSVLHIYREINKNITAHIWLYLHVSSTLIYQ